MLKKQLAQQLFIFQLMMDYVQFTVGARHTRQIHGPSKQILELEAHTSFIKPNRLEDAIEYVLAYNYSVMNL